MASNMMKGYLTHRREMRELDNPNPYQSLSQKRFREQREKDRWSEELYEHMLDWKEKHPRKMSRK